MLDKDYSGLSDLIHPDASVFGTALREIEYGFLNVKNYCIKSLGQLPDEMFIHLTWKRLTDFGNLELEKQVAEDFSRVILNLCNNAFGYTE